jgi:hypothetical protein
MYPAQQAWCVWHVHGSDNTPSARAKKQLVQGMYSTFTTPGDALLYIE